jgi:hypothetical protein
VNFRPDHLCSRRSKQELVMSGRASPRNGVFAQYIGLVKYLGDSKRTRCQQFCGSALVLVPLLVLLVLSAGIFVAVSQVDPTVLRWFGWVALAAGLCGGGILVRMARRARTVGLGPKPGQDLVGGNAGTEGDQSTDQDGNDASNGPVGA